MKTLTLKENQALYEAVSAVSADEPIVVERNGKPAYVLVPYAEYQAWRAQRTALPANWLDQTPEEVVAEIKRLGPSRMVREPLTSLAEVLANSPHDPDFNLEEWTREWAKIEAEMKEAERRDWLKTEAEMRAVLGSDE